ncbi:MAG: phytanoyl-CoA dioxygenase family protein [Pseudomonadota bacterium]
MTQLDAAQLAHYEREGYLILRGAIGEGDLARLERGVANNPPLDGTLDPNAPVFPAPGRYTLATQCARDPDLAFIIEHPQIVDPVRQILEDDPKLTAYVIYDRTPGGNGLPAHHDYKRWRPVGSSMDWLFTIVPFCDYNAEAGPLYLAPRSHHLGRIRDGEFCKEVAPAIKPAADDFIDPELKRGDLLLMNMHLWHKADANNSASHRVGLFNKYAAASAPPATGYYLFHSDVHDALSADGRSLIAVHSTRDIMTTRALLTRERDGSTEIFLRETGQGLHLPGGLIKQERAIPDWDLGNMIAALQQHLREQVLIEVPWLSYIGDYEEGDGLCRLYGYRLNDNGFPVPYDGVWLSSDKLSDARISHPFAAQALTQWLDPTIVRGKGLSQAQCRVDQFAY